MRLHLQVQCVPTYAYVNVYLPCRCNVPLYTLIKISICTYPCKNLATSTFVNTYRCLPLGCVPTQLYNTLLHTYKRDASHIYAMHIFIPIQDTTAYLYKARLLYVCNEQLSYLYNAQLLYLYKTQLHAYIMYNYTAESLCNYLTYAIRQPTSMLCATTIYIPSTIAIPV